MNSSVENKAEVTEVTNKRAETHECGSCYYHKETMRDTSGAGRESLVRARLVLAGNSFSAPEPIQVDARGVFRSHPRSSARSPPIFFGDFPPPPRALSGETWEGNVMQPPARIVIGNTKRQCTRRWCSRIFKTQIFQNTIVNLWLWSIKQIKCIIFCGRRNKCTHTYIFVTPNVSTCKMFLFYVNIFQ